eukprot:9476448-Pyramimonas_sp.AAC.1
MEGGSSSKWDSRPSATHIGDQCLQKLHGWRRQVPFQNAALAVAPHTFVSRVHSRSRDVYGRRLKRNVFAL